MIEERDGWFVVNVKDTAWYGTPAFGKVCIFENPEERFPDTGVRVYVLEPGKPNCRYHRESAQEDFLVLAGRCTLLVNDEERALETWDFVHCPAGVSHVFVGAGDGPCALLAIGDRTEGKQIGYPASALARAHGAEVPEPTTDPKVAYADVPSWGPTETPDWPPA
jgi:quercetin dioxygenase-like cupin family protein